MRRKLRRKNATFLCSFMILMVPCISASASASASASQPSSPTSQETVANGIEADEIPQNPTDAAAATAKKSVSGMEPESEIEGQSDIEDESFTTKENETPKHKQEEIPHNEKAATESDDSITLIETGLLSMWKVMLQ